MGENTGGGTRTVHEILDSSLDSVDHAEQVAMDLAQESGFEEEDLHKIGMSVRECMVNAVVHGNRYNAQKKVDFSISLANGRYTIRIADQGDGFELSDLPDPLAEENLLRHSGRGIFLVRAFMDDFQVRRISPSGTEVILVKNVVAPA
ncbi:MAG: ATP-binding protein [Acidobacteria bacterium]|nr:ATP-binding protein [Acidobacteriota bacterium]MBI3473203.1 ATP-binding protein [Candidatus Solibacter usitatus]